MVKTKNIVNILAMLFVALPLVLYWGSATRASFDYPYKDADPEYTYFLTSLAPFKGSGYGYVDHPGTPVEVLGSILLGSTAPWAGKPTTAGFIQYHFYDPRLFFLLAHGFLLTFSIFCAIYFYRTAIKGQSWQYIPVAGSLALLFYALHPMGFMTLKYWSHNSFNFPFGTLLLLSLYRVVQQKGDIARRNIILLGLGVGLLTTVVVYFGVWFLGVALTIAVFYRAQGMSLKRIGADITIFAVSSAAGFLLGVLPVITKISRFSNWVVKLITHQGIYGSGEEGITSTALLASNFLVLVQSSRLLFLFVGLTWTLLLIVMVWRGGKLLTQKPGLVALSIGLSLQIAFSVIIIAKHPGGLYLLSIAAAAPVLGLAVMGLYREFPGPAKIINLALVLIFVMGLAMNYGNSIRRSDRTVAYLQVLNQEIDQVVSERAAITGRSPQEMVVLWAHAVWTDLPCNTLGRMNNNYVHTFAGELAKVCKNQYFIASEFGKKPIASSLFEYKKGSPRKVDINELAWDLVFISDRNIGLLYPRFKVAVNIQSLPKTPGVSIIYRE
jgi:hypothetical protein